MSEIAHLGPVELLTPKGEQSLRCFFLYGIEPGGNRLEVTT